MSFSERAPPPVNGASLRLSHPGGPLGTPDQYPPPLPPINVKSRPKSLPGPPGGLELNLDRGPQSPPQKPPENKRSKIMSLPLPKIDADQNGDKMKKLRQPTVIDKVQAGPMTEDGRDWGERCVDMYKIVDKVRLRSGTRRFLQFFFILSGWGRNLWRGVQGNAPTRVEHRAWRVVGTQESETRKREGRFSYHSRQRNQDSQTVETQEHHQTERNCH